MTEPIKLNLTLEELKLIDKYVELNDDTQQLFNKIKSAYPSQKSPLEEAYKDWWGQYPELETDSKYDDTRWQGFQAGFHAAYEEKVREDDYYDKVKLGRKDNPKPMDEVVDRMVEKRKSQKLWNILKDRWGFPEDACGDIVEAVAEWFPKEQSASGSQNVNTELLVEGYNDCLRQIKEMLR